MASVKAINIPEQQKMITAIWETYKKYYYPEDNDTWWKEMLDSFRKVSDKYPTKLCRQVCADFIVDIKSHKKDIKEGES